MSDELDELRKKRLEELQSNTSEPQQNEVARRQQEEARNEYERQKQAILRKILTDGAKQRLSNIKLVKPQMAEVVETQLIQIAQSGRVPGGIISEEQLLQMLRQIQHGKRESNIKFKRV